MNKTFKSLFLSKKRKHSIGLLEMNLTKYIFCGRICQGKELSSSGSNAAIIQLQTTCKQLFKAADNRGISITRKAKKDNLFTNISTVLVC
jgi:hypothetical protein